MLQVADAIGRWLEWTLERLKTPAEIMNAMEHGNKYRPIQVVIEWPRRAAVLANHRPRGSRIPSEAPNWRCWPASTPRGWGYFYKNMVDDMNLR
jgi:hypothetical protein